MNLSPHFSLDEATVSDTAVRLGISNIPDDTILGNMIIAANNMEVLRECLGNKVINVTSWYRSPTLNIVIPGSSKTSSHQVGYAIDCSVAGLSPLELCYIAKECFIKKGIKVDQIIHEYGRWMHISFDPRARGEYLTIFKNNSGKKYMAGFLTEKEYNSI